MKVYLMRGLPKSGKTTWIGKTFHGKGLLWVFSADAFFTDFMGVYNFDPAKLGEAHGECLKGFTDVVSDRDKEDGDIVVDNTNLTAVELAPYVALCNAYGVEYEIVRIEATLEQVAERDNGHDVPTHTLARMDAILWNERLPPWWNKETVIQPS